MNNIQSLFNFKNSVINSINEKVSHLEKDELAESFIFVNGQSWLDNNLRITTKPEKIGVFHASELETKKAPFGFKAVKIVDYLKKFQ